MKDGVKSPYFSNRSVDRVVPAFTGGSKSQDRYLS
jgi:hypothetical protein